MHKRIEQNAGSWRTRWRAGILLLCIAAACSGCSALKTSLGPASSPPKTQTVLPKVALVLGGGGTRGFAHVGVIKVLEANGIKPDIIVGTSAGSVVGALYAAGYSPSDLQRVALRMDDTMVADWSMPDRGVIKGQALQDFISQAVMQRPIEKLNKPFGVVATDLQTGAAVVFRRGDTALAVRASSSVPGIFQPVVINGREYVDGGLVSPVPVRAARTMGADVVIAVDISESPTSNNVSGVIGVLLQTFTIMGQSIANYELKDADVVIRPDIGGVGSADFDNRQQAIDGGAKAAQAALATIQQKIAEKTVTIAVPQ